MPSATTHFHALEMKGLDPKNPAKWFRDHGKPVPPSFPTANEIRKEAKDRATKILSDYETLRQILDRHEDTIRKRWLKKTKKQQRSILLEVWPNMAPSHRPDFEALKRESNEAAQRQAGMSRFRDWYLCPIINIEDLTLKRSLLHLLHSRGRHPPGSFARADFNRTGLGLACTAISLPFIFRHTMFLGGLSTNSYGRVVSWDDEDEAEEMLRSGRAFDPCAGLLILEVQERIMRFTVECCQSILHDLSASGSLIDSTFPIKEPLLPITTDASDYPTTVGLAIERQYRAPIDFDLKRLRAIIGAKRAEAEDHIWALREDPGYFADTIIEWSEHRRERLIDTNGNDHPVGPKRSQNYALFWERVIAHTLANAYGTLINWHILDRQLKNLENLKDKYINTISPQRKLPHEYLQALLTFRQMLTEAQQRPMMNLENHVPASPPLRSLYVRLPQDPSTTMITIQSRKPNNGELIYMLQLLWDPLQTHNFGLSDILDQLEHWILEQPSEKARLSTLVSDGVSDIGLLAQARDELDGYQPWAAGMDHEFSKVHEKLEKEVFEQFNVRQVIDHNMKAVVTGLAPLGSPAYAIGPKRFHYPSDKRRTRENTEAMQLAEQNLDEFWARFDAKYKSKVGKTINEIVEGFLFQNRDLRRTPEWVEPEPKPRKSKSETIESMGDSFSGLGLTSNESPSPKSFPAPKAKVKTKGMAGTSESHLNVVETDDDDNVQEDIQPTISVDRRAYKVFKTLFFTPNLNDLPGEIPWTDFLYALASTVFRPEKLYGSVWQFTPVNLDVERSIHFHEPHPSSKIPFRIARRMGRRLNRAYGWHSGMFVLI